MNNPLANPLVVSDHMVSNLCKGTTLRFLYKYQNHA
uniref:Uncharacterized protein n=1 Tax=Arundo donax TaxID=35708 RepID=A0A0A9ERM7_ARUDO